MIKGSKYLLWTFYAYSGIIVRGEDMKQVGNTPIVKYENLYFKLENQNPTGSIKDRAAYNILKSLFINSGLIFNFLSWKAFSKERSLFFAIFSYSKLLNLSSSSLENT